MIGEDKNKYLLETEKKTPLVAAAERSKSEESAATMHLDSVDSMRFSRISYDNEVSEGENDLSNIMNRLRSER